ncbi:MAG TPA: ABC-type transport auxiliary lipoprotein family protein [Novosphingobium sp.]|nr:ABC-type transport auxiliary lipoprotein family protein [Novosphingobium sp.]
MTRLTLVAPLAAALLLGGCISFGPKVPDTLFNLTATAPAAAGSGASGTLESAIVVLEPDAEQRLDVVRVPVQIDDAHVAYLKNATWVERPAALFQRLLAETIRARGSRLVLDSDPGSGDTTRLTGRLLDMGYDARSSSAVVRFEAVRSQVGGRIDTRRFESRVGGIASDAKLVAPALDQAANDVARQVAEWVG